jgi:hypothetical protein
MKNTAKALVFVALLLAGTPVLAENPVEPAAPGSDKAPGVTPNDARSIHWAWHLLLGGRGTTSLYSTLPLSEF